MNRRFDPLGRVFLLVAIPVIVLGIHGANAVARHLSEAGDHEIESSRALFVPVATELVHELQAERSLTSAILSGATELRPSLERQRGKVDLAAGQFRASLRSLDAELGVRMTISSAAVAEIGSHRAQVDDGTAPAADAMGWYARSISTILGGLSAFDGRLDDAEMIQQTIALRHLSMSKELVDRERAFGGSVIARGFFSDGREHAEYLETRAAALVHREIFVGHANAEQVRSLREATLNTGDADRLRGYMRQAHPGETLEIDGSIWWTEMSGTIDAMRASEIAMSSSLSRLAAERAEHERRAALSLALETSGALLVVAMVGAAVLRSIRQRTDPQDQREDSWLASAKYIDRRADADR